jgi:hypothetical protein
LKLLLDLVILNVFVHGIIAGTSFDVAFVKLPTRKRIGQIAYANFARNNDLGNGILVYPVLGITALILTFGTTLLAFFRDTEFAIMIPLYVSCVFTIAHSLITAKAAPIMLSLKTTRDEELVLKKKLDRFAFWHSFRTVFQVSTFVSWIWALIEIRMI